MDANPYLGEVIGKVPEEIADKFVEAQACKECMEACVARWFGAKRAIIYAKRAVLLREQAWQLTKELYVSVFARPWKSSRYNEATREITIIYKEEA